MSAEEFRKVLEELLERRKQGPTTIDEESLFVARLDVLWYSMTDEEQDEEEARNAAEMVQDS